MSRAGWLCGLGVVIAGSLACSSGPSVAYRELLDDDPHVRVDAVRRLGAARAPDAVDSLVAMLADASIEVRVEAIAALAEIADDTAVPALLEHLKTCTRDERVKLARDLAAFGDSSVVPALAGLLYDTDETIRTAAAISLGDREEPEALETLLEVALLDENERVRQHVIKVIGVHDAKFAIPHVETALAAEADKVRANAARVLGDIGDRSSVPVLLDALDDEFYKVRSLSAHALAEVAPDDEDVRQALRDRLDIEHHEMCMVDIAWSLAKMGDGSKLETVRRLLARGNPEDVRAEAAMALGEVGDSSDIPRLELAMKDKRGLVRKQAFLAIQKLKEA